VSDLHTNTGTRKRGRYVIFAAWIVTAATLAAICINHRVIRQNLNHYQSQNDTVSPPENQINGLTYCRYDPNTNRLRFAASVRSLRAENAKFGIFRTAAARTIKVKDLRLRFCESGDSTVTTALRDKILFDRLSGGNKNLGEFITQLADVRDYYGADIDLSNTREVTVDNFDCRVFEDDNLLLSVESRRAVVDSDWPKVSLRGHVTVTCADGSTLEGNHIKWNTKEQSFTVDGTYFLRRGECQIAGKGICVDSQLNIVEIKNAKR